MNIKAGEALLNDNVQSNECDYVVKCIFVGEPCSGKTSLMNTLANDAFEFNVESTIGIDFKTLFSTGKRFDGKLINYKLQMWDCAGQIKFRSIVSSYFRLTHIAYIVFDLTDRLSFEHVRIWVDDIRRNHNSLHNDIIMVLIGNKCDLKDEYQVSEQEVWKFVTDMGLDAYIATSALTGQNVREAVNIGVSRLHKLFLAGKVELDSCFKTKDRVILTSASQSKNHDCCLIN